MEGVSRGDGPHVLRSLNAAAVLSALRRIGAARVADLAVATGLTRPTVTQALSTLELAGWIEPAPGPAQRQLGRPAQQMRFRAEAGHVVGVDVGPHKILAVVADLAGTVLAEHRLDSSSVRGGPEVIAAVISATAAVLTEAQVNRNSVLAVCAGTPGLVAGGEITLAPSIPGWTEVSLSDELARKFSCPILIENDVNAAVLAENWLGVTDPLNTVVFVHWGARLGAGLLIGGRLHRGSRAAAGEIGFLDLEEVPGNQPGTDRLGSFEAAVGAEAVVSLARQVAKAHKGALSSHLKKSADRWDVSPIFRCATDGDEAAISVIDQIAARFARGLAPLFLVLDPDLVVIGGGLSTGGPLLLEAIERHIHKRTLIPPRIVLSKLADTSVAVGAVRFALDEVERRLFSPNALLGH